MFVFAYTYFSRLFRPTFEQTKTIATSKSSASRRTPVRAAATRRPLPRQSISIDMRSCLSSLVSRSRSRHRRVVGLTMFVCVLFHFLLERDRWRSRRHLWHIVVVVVGHGVDCRFAFALFVRRIVTQCSSIVRLVRGARRREGGRNVRMAQRKPTRSLSYRFRFLACDVCFVVLAVHSRHLVAVCKSSVITSFDTTLNRRFR